MGRSRFVVAVALGLELLSLGANRAEADVITISYSWIASSFACVTGCAGDLGAPVDPVTGAFVLTFDNSRNLVEQTAGLTVSDLNIPLDSVPAYGYGAASDTLVLGGLQGGAQTMNPDTNDFLFGINNVSSKLLQNLNGCRCFGYARSGHTAIWQPNALTLMPEPIPAIPEPATLSLVAVGAALMALRRQRICRLP